MNFVEATGKKAVITSLNNLENALKGINVTEIHK